MCWRLAGSGREPEHSVARRRTPPPTPTRNPTACCCHMPPAKAFCTDLALLAVPRIAQMQLEALAGREESTTQPPLRHRCHQWWMCKLFTQWLPGMKGLCKLQ